MITTEVRKILLYTTLIFAIIFSYCSKNSSGSEDVEDKIIVEVTVLEDGTPAENIFVEIESKVQETVKNFGANPTEDQVKSYETTQIDRETTNSKGKVTFNYMNKSLPTKGGIIINKITLKRINTVLEEDTQERFIKKGETEKLSYDIGS